MLTKAGLRSAVKEVLAEHAQELSAKDIEELEEALVDRIAVEGDVFADEDEDEADEEEE